MFNPLLFSWQALSLQDRNGAASSPTSSWCLQCELFDVHVFGAKAMPSLFPKAKDMLCFMCNQRKTEAKVFFCSVCPG